MDSRNHNKYFRHQIADVVTLMDFNSFDNYVIYVILACIILLLAFSITWPTFLQGFTKFIVALQLYLFIIVFFKLLLNVVIARYCI